MKNIEDDNGCNTSGNETFQDVLDARVSRRGLISSGFAAAAFLSLGGVDALLRAVPWLQVRGPESQKEHIRTAYMPYQMRESPPA